MNDNLKFRGFTVSGEWKFGSLVRTTNGKVYILQINSTTIEEYNQNWLINTPAFEVIPETVSQFTGVIDVEGNEIYGRDILEVLSIDSDEDKDVLKILEIYFDEELCSFEFRNDWEPFNRQYGNDFRILGNIFDNPGLINGAIQTVA